MEKIKKINEKLEKLSGRPLEYEKNIIERFEENLNNCLNTFKNEVNKLYYGIEQDKFFITAKEKARKIIEEWNI